MKKEIVVKEIADFSAAIEERITRTIGTGTL